MVDYCNTCSVALDDGDTVVCDHDGTYAHYDCWRDGGCQRHGLNPFTYQGDTVTEEHHSPDHYKKGGHECIDICRSVLGDVGFVSGCRMVMLQYLWRLGDKDESVKEARKIETYARWMRETLEGKALTK